MTSDEPETVQINTCRGQATCRTPSAQISDLYESKMDDSIAMFMPSAFYAGTEIHQKFLEPVEFDLENYDSQQFLYEDVLIRKKSIESMNSLVPIDEDNWTEFNRMNDNNSFVID